jgi:hypothetical protein
VLGCTKCSPTITNIDSCIAAKGSTAGDITKVICKAGYSLIGYD